jgi:hypothetical protein
MFRDKRNTARAHRKGSQGLTVWTGMDYPD